MRLSRRMLFRPEGDPGGAGGAGGGNGDPDPGDPNPEPPAGEEGGTRSGTSTEMVPRKEAEEARREAQALRKRLKDAEKERDDLKGASQTDLERETERAKKLGGDLTTANDRVRDLTVRVLAEQVGIDPTARADAARLLDWSQIEDPSDEDAVLKALKALVKDRPYLTGTSGGADGGTGGRRQGGAGTDMNDLIREAAGFGSR